MTKKQVGIRVYEETKIDLDRIQRILSFEKNEDQTTPDVVQALARDFLNIYDNKNKTVLTVEKK